MSSPTPPDLDAFRRRLGALDDPARLRLLALVEREELSVSELAEILQLPQSTVSRHLKVLGEGGWIAGRSERTANLYRMLDGDLAPGARSLWAQAKGDLAGWPELEQDRLRLERRLAARSGAAFFAGAAAEWDRLRGELYGERFTEAAIAALLPASWVVADLACGSGVVTERLAAQVARVVAVDASAEMLAAARARLAGRGNVELHQADLARLPLADGSVDAALLLLALTHVEAPAAALAELARVLRPGGRAVVVDLLAHDRDDFRRRMGQLRNGFGPEELAALAAAAGLTEIRCAPLAPEPGAKGPALLLATGARPTNQTTTGSGAVRVRERKRR